VKDGVVRPPEPRRRGRDASTEAQRQVDRAERARWVSPTIEPFVPPWDLERASPPARDVARGAEGSPMPWPAIAPDAVTSSSDPADRTPEDAGWDRARPIDEHAPLPTMATERSAIAGAPDVPEVPHPWPDLPAESFDDVDAAVTIREWERRRRLELEQRSL
jgi:hypothetical protein